MPWRNAVFLFVNVLPAEQAPYPNAFLDGGRRITWCAAHGKTCILPGAAGLTNTQFALGECLQVPSLKYCLCTVKCQILSFSLTLLALPVPGVQPVGVRAKTGNTPRHVLLARRLWTPRSAHSRMHSLIRGVLLGTPARHTLRATRSCDACWAPSSARAAVARGREAALQRWPMTSATLCCRTGERWCCQWAAPARAAAPSTLTRP